MTSSPTKARYHDLGIFYFDENLDITDMGYQMENNWLFFGSQNGLKFTDYGEDSIFQSNQVELGVGYEANGDLDKSANFTYLTYKTYLKNTSLLSLQIFTELQVKTIG